MSLAESFLSQKLVLNSDQINGDQTASYNDNIYKKFDFCVCVCETL